MSDVFLCFNETATTETYTDSHTLSLHDALPIYAALIVCDPRFTRTAAHADEYVRFRPGTDVAVIWGILWHIFENGWEDKEYIRQRVYGMDQIRPEVAKWNPEETERVTGGPGAQMERVARKLAKNRPFAICWGLGYTQPQRSETRRVGEKG